jgi:broad specificity phosphatase PhoE
MSKTNLNFKNIYIIRHGETEWNVIGKHQGGEADIPLNDVGREQARKTGLYIKNFRLRKHNIDCIWTSPLSRAKETAEIIKKEIDIKSNIEFKIFEELKENGSGKNSGLTKNEEPLKTHKEKIKEFIATKTNIEMEEEIIEFMTKLNNDLEIGMEPYESCVNRANKIIDEIRKSKCQNIIIVSHSGFLNILIPQMYNISEFLINNNNCAISYHKYDILNDKFQMIAPPSNNYLEKIDLIGGDNNIWNKIKIIKSLGKGTNGETFLIELDNQQYALKKQKILESEKDMFDDEIKFFEWIKKLNANQKKFFMQLYHYRIDNDCKFDFIPIRGNIDKEHIKSNLCFDMILELKQNTLDKIINKLSKQQIISAFIQISFAVFLMQKSEYYHFDSKTDNIAYNKTNNDEINIGNFGKIKTFGYQYSLIDYGSVLQKEFKLDEYDKKMLEAQKYFNGDIMNMIDYILLKNEEIFSQIQENKIHLKTKEAHELFMNIPNNKINKITKILEKKLNVDFIDELKKIDSDNVKKEPKYMFAIYCAITIYRVKFPKSFMNQLSKQFNINIKDNNIIFAKKELLYLIKNQNKLKKIIKYLKKRVVNNTPLLWI